MLHSCVPSLPFAHLNLRCNPFGELSISEWTAQADVDLSPILGALDQPRSAVQLIGDKGFGKTTHLLALRARCESAGYVHIPEGERRGLPTGSPVLIDEAQRLTMLQRWQLFRSSVPLVLGTHHDFQNALLRSGRHVLTIHVETQVNSDRLHRILNARIAAARRHPGAIPTVSRSTVDQLMAQFGPNIRQIVHELYARIQRLSEVAEL